MYLKKVCVVCKEEEEDQEEEKRAMQVFNIYSFIIYTFWIRELNSHTMKKIIKKYGNIYVKMTTAFSMIMMIMILLDDNESYGIWLVLKLFHLACLMLIRCVAHAKGIHLIRFDELFCYHNGELLPSNQTKVCAML